MLEKMFAIELTEDGDIFIANNCCVEAGKYKEHRPRFKRSKLLVNNS